MPDARMSWSLGYSYHQHIAHAAVSLATFLPNAASAWQRPCNRQKANGGIVHVGVGTSWHLLEGTFNHAHAWIAGAALSRMASSAHLLSSSFCISSVCTA